MKGENMRTVTVQAYTLDELADNVRARVIHKHREDVDFWATAEAGEAIADRLHDVLDGVDELEATAWSLHYYRGVVLEGTVTDSRTFARSLGVIIPDGVTVRLAPHHGRGVWPGETDVVYDDEEDGEQKHEQLTAALHSVADDALRFAAQIYDEMTSDEAIAAELDGALFDARGSFLGRIGDDSP